MRWQIIRTQTVSFIKPKISLVVVRIWSLTTPCAWVSNNRWKEDDCVWILLSRTSKCKCGGDCARYNSSICKHMPNWTFQTIGESALCYSITRTNLPVVGIKQTHYRNKQLFQHLKMKMIPKLTFNSFILHTFFKFSLLIRFPSINNNFHVVEGVERGCHMSFSRLFCNVWSELNHQYQGLLISAGNVFGVSALVILLYHFFQV